MNPLSTIDAVALQIYMARELAAYEGGAATERISVKLMTVTSILLAHIHDQQIASIAERLIQNLWEQALDPNRLVRPIAGLMVDVTWPYRFVDSLAYSKSL